MLTLTKKTTLPARDPREADLEKAIAELKAENAALEQELATIEREIADTSKLGRGALLSKVTGGDAWRERAGARKKIDALTERRDQVFARLAEISDNLGVADAARTELRREVDAAIAPQLAEAIKSAAKEAETARQTFVAKNARLRELGQYAEQQFTDYANMRYRGSSVGITTNMVGLGYFWRDVEEAGPDSRGASWERELRYVFPTF